MSLFAARYTPLGAIDGGFVAATVPAGATALANLVAVPPEATSAWVQAQGGAVGYRQDGDDSAATGQVLPEGALLPVANRAQVRGLVLLGTGAETVAVQFFTGAVGAMPPLPG